LREESLLSKSKSFEGGTRSRLSILFAEKFFR